jgi:hypothetical protein
MITPDFLHNVETGMRLIQNQEYQRLLPAVSEVWKIAKHTTSMAAKERVLFALDTAGIRYEDKHTMGVEFEELLMTEWSYEHKGATAGLEVIRSKFEDIDNSAGIPGGEGVKQAQAWTRQVTAQGVYWPRKQVFEALRNGDQTGFVTYDTKKFFDTAHPVNVFDAAAGTFNNVFTGAASGAYPGACPIDASVTLDVAFTNFAKVLAYIEGAIKMPNGEDPRMLKVSGLWVPAALKVRAQQLTNAKFIAAAAATGGGSSDVESTIRNWGVGQPYVAPELGAGFTNGSDTSYYIVCEQLSGDELGGIGYSEREPFGIVYNTGMTDAQLQRANKLQWSTRGRNNVYYGHPYLIFKVKAT